MTALVLAGFAFVAFVPGVVALVLARREDRDIAEGRSAADGLPWLRIARALVWSQWAAMAVGSALLVLH